MHGSWAFPMLQILSTLAYRLQQTDMLLEEGRHAKQVKRAEYLHVLLFVCFKSQFCLHFSCLRLACNNWCVIVHQKYPPRSKPNLRDSNAVLLFYMLLFVLLHCSYSHSQHFYCELLVLSLNCLMIWYTGKHTLFWAWLLSQPFI